MSKQKKLKIFSTFFLTLAFLIANQPDFAVLAEVSGDDQTSEITDDEDGETAEDGETDAASGDAYVLGGIHPEGTVYSESVYIVNTDTGIPVYALNEKEKLPPASTVKVMTALLTLEKVGNLNEKVEFPTVCTDEFLSGDPNKSGAASADVYPGQENLTYTDCLYGLLLASGNDTANILAYNVSGGDISEFVAMMNAKAKEIGCENTNFTNPHGLYEADNWSCAYDMYLITQYAYDNYPLFMEICGTYEYEMPPNVNNPNGYTLVNTNMMIKENDSSNPYYYEFAKGIKTGSLDEYFEKNADGEWERIDGNIANLVSLAQRDKLSYIIVTFGAEYVKPYTNENNDSIKAQHHAYLDHEMFYRWAFSTFEYIQVLSKNEPIRSVKVTEGKDVSELRLYPQMDEDYWTLLPKGIDVKSAIQYKVSVDADEVAAPVEAGTVFGSVELLLSNKTLGKWQLVTVDGAERSQSAVMVDKANEVFDQWWFKPLVVLLALLIIALVILNFMRKSQKEKSKRKQNRRIRR